MDYSRESVSLDMSSYLQIVSFLELCYKIYNRSVNLATVLKGFTWLQMAMFLSKSRLEIIKQFFFLFRKNFALAARN